MIKILKALSGLNKSLDGKKSVGFGFVMIALGFFAPSAKEWAEANPQQAIELYGYILSTAGTIVILLRKWRNIFLDSEKENILAKLVKAKNAIPEIDMIEPEDAWPTIFRNETPYAHATPVSPPSWTRPDPPVVHRYPTEDSAFQDSREPIPPARAPRGVGETA